MIHNFLLKIRKLFQIRNHHNLFVMHFLAPQPGNITFPINQTTLSGGLTVSDLDVKKTIIQLAENLKIVVEPGGAAAAAALLFNKIQIKNKNVVVMISGGNIDYSFFSTIIDQEYE